MADGTPLNPATLPGGDTVADRDIGGKKHQQVIAEFATGAPGASAPTEVSPSTPMPVVQTGTPALPTGASTEATLAAIKAKTDNLDVALSTRTKPADVQSVSVTNFPGTQPVSGPLTDTQLRATAVPVSGPLTDAQIRASALPVSAAALPLPAGAATEATLATVAKEGVKITSETLEAGGSSVLGWLSSIRKAITDRLNTLGQKTSASSSPVVLASDQSNVGIKDSSGNPITATPLGQATKSNSLPFTLASDQGALPVTDSEKVADNAAFTDGTTKVQPAGFVLDETPGTALTENDAAAARIDSKRAQVAVIEDETTRGRRVTVTASNALKVDGSAVTQPVSGPLTDTQLRASAVPVSGPLTDAQLRASAVPVSAAALPLPTGAATETTLAAINTASGAQADAEAAAGNGSLIAILKRIRTLLGWGQRAMASSMSVTLASDQDLSAPISATGTLGALAATVSLTLTGQKHVSVALVGANAFNGKISVDYMSLNGEWETRFFHSGDGLVAEDKLPAGTGANRRNYNLATMPGDLQVRVRVSGYNSGSMTAWLRASNTKDWWLTCNVPQPYRTLDTVIGALNAGIVVVPFGPDVGFMVEPGTFAGTLGIDGSYDDGTTWGLLNMPFRDLTNDMTRTSLVLTNPNSVVAIAVPVPNGITYVRMVAKAYTGGNFVAMAASRPESGSVRIASGVADTPASGALGALNAAITVPLQGQASVGFAIDAGTLTGNVVIETSSNGGLSWDGALFNDGTRWRVLSAPMVFTSPSVATRIDLPPTSSATHVRLRVSVYTSGTANASGKACQISSAVAMALTAGVSGVATPYFAQRIAGDNGANLQAVAALTTTPASTDPGLVTRNIQPELGTLDSRPTAYSVLDRLRELGVKIDQHAKIGASEATMLKLLAAQRPPLSTSPNTLLHRN